VREMSFNGLRLEYALEGTSNFIDWNEKMEVVLNDCNTILPHLPKQSANQGKHAMRGDQG